MTPTHGLALVRIPVESLVPEVTGESVVWFLQGGGALGAYQAGAYEALAVAGYAPDWIVGISVGAINAAIIAGNPPERCLQRLRRFRETVSANFSGKAPIGGEFGRTLFNEASAALVAWLGVPGYFRPRVPRRSSTDREHRRR